MLASYRGYDTLGETTVVFTAGAGVVALLRRRRRARAEENAMTHDLILRVVAKLLIPFILLFALYVQFHGEFGPGGGFQAGVIMAAAHHPLRASCRARGRAAARARRLVETHVAAGVLIYAGVGIVGLLLGGNFLDYSCSSTTPCTARSAASSGSRSAWPSPSPG